MKQRRKQQQSPPNGSPSKGHAALSPTDGASTCSVAAAAAAVVAEAGIASCHPSGFRRASWRWGLIFAVIAGAAAVAGGFLMKGMWSARPGHHQQSYEHGPDSPAWAQIASLRQEDMPTPQNLEWHVITESPRIYVMDDFLSDAECEFLKETVKERLEPAKVVQKKENKYDTQVSLRNNKQMWMSYEEEMNSAVLRHIIKRIHRAARVPDDDAEALQIGKYDVDEKYELHLDSDPKNDVARPATMIIYLNDVKAGGETLFPLRSKDRSQCSGNWHTDADGNKSFGVKQCCLKTPSGMLRIPPRRGRAVLFWNHDTLGETDALAEHAACPILEGEKWIAQRWFRFAPYQRIVHPPDQRFDGLPVAGPAGASNVSGLEVRVLSQKSPRVYLIENMLTQEECQHLKSIGEGLKIAGSPEGGMSRRWLTAGRAANDSKVSAMVKRMHRLALVPEANAEPLQIGSYPPGGALDLHLDSDPGRKIVRPLTLLVYLDTAENHGGSAGATIFPRGNCQDVASCCKQAKIWGGDASGPLLVPPKRGRALLFASHNLDGTLDPTSIHGSCAAGQEGKWIVQRWFRNQPYSKVKFKPDTQFDGLHSMGSD